MDRKKLAEVKLQEKRQELLKKAHLFKRLFSTDDGQKVMQHLKEYCEPSEIFDRDPHACAYNCARRDFYRFIVDLMEHGNEKL